MGCIEKFTTGLKIEDGIHNGLIALRYFFGLTVLIGLVNRHD